MDRDKLKIVKLPVGNLMNIPAMLRRIADQMESGALDKPFSLVMVSEIVHDGGCDIDVFFLGDSNETKKIIGLLEIGKHNILSGGGIMPLHLDPAPAA